jgi:hypothetical protein
VAASASRTRRPPPWLRSISAHFARYRLPLAPRLPQEIAGVCRAGLPLRRSRRHLLEDVAAFGALTAQGQTEERDTRRQVPQWTPRDES